MAHVPNLGCEYAFTTDCGAIFRPQTVGLLIKHLDRHPECVAVTGRQRVMKEFNQRALGQEPPQKDTFFQGCLRKLQGFDFEVDHVAGKAANCAAGLLPCLHGPCAMFRYTDIAGRCLDDYFDVWGYAPPNKLNILGANLQLAEDRIPSLLGVLYSGKTSDSCFDATFEFEAEMSLRAFVTQRRRWGNGALASLLFGLSQTWTTIRSSHTLPFKFANLTVLVLQIISQVLTFFTPAMFGYLFGATIRAVHIEVSKNYKNLTTFNGTESSMMGIASCLIQQNFSFSSLNRCQYSMYETMFYIIYSIMYITFVSIHLKRKPPYDCVVHIPSFLSIITFNAVMMHLVMFMLTYEFFVYNVWQILATFMFITLMPFVNICISGSWEGLYIMVSSFYVFTLATPTFIGFFPAYNFARLSDLTWGNRPTISHAKAVERKISLTISSLRSDRSIAEDELVIVEDEEDLELEDGGEAGKKETFFASHSKDTYSIESKQLAQWLSLQITVCKIMNFILVVANVILMVLLEFLLKRGAFLPEFSGSRTVMDRTYTGALEICVIFSTPWCIILIIGFAFHAQRQVRQQFSHYWQYICCCHGYWQLSESGEVNNEEGDMDATSMTVNPALL
eukprot:g2958.t1